MQASRTSGYLSGSVKLETHYTKRGQRVPRQHPVWLLRYRAPSGQSERILGKAWVSASHWESRKAAIELRTQPAEGYLNRAQAEIAAQRFLDAKAPEMVPADRRTFEVAGQAFITELRRVIGKRRKAGSTLSEYERLVRHIGRQHFRDQTENGEPVLWQDTALGAFSTADLLAYYDHLRDERELAASTLNHHRRVLRGIFGKHHPVWEHWPFIAPDDADSEELHCYQPEQVALLRAHLVSDMDRAIITLATQAGPRMSEIRGLRVENVDDLGEPGALIRFVYGYTDTGGFDKNKGKKLRSIGLTPELRTALRPYVGGKSPGDLVFPKSSHMPNVPICGTSLYRRFVAAAERAGLPVLRFHDLRHSFGTRAIQTFRPHQVQHMMGHADIRTTERYIHYTPDPETGEKLAALWETNPNIVALPPSRGGRPARHPGGCPKCGEPKAPGQPYCLAHQREAHRVSDRRRAS